ncbi:MAG: ASKHA domain-containing protein [Firmicutes bacterium]|nr:ASKHA domain-containing protein [Bacillota bacterium]
MNRTRSESCIGNCLLCGKCGSFAILEDYAAGTEHVEARQGFGAAVDIGTTNVVMALFDLRTGVCAARHSFMNPQRAYGPDVISRIGAAGHGALADMRRLIVENIALGIETLLDARVDNPQLEEIVAAGNTVMTHLLLGLSCESLGVSPFQPAHRPEEQFDFRDVFGVSTHSCPVVIVPWFAGFVGGDITAGLLSILPGAPERFLLIDLGTNGEMALYDHGRLTVTATAAGPAFEGSSHGGGASGVLDDLARLVREGAVDETGLLADSAPALFTQKEIRDLQLAKSAVRSGLEILLETAGLDYETLGPVYLAGGIGQALCVDSAVTVGLLPAELKDKVRAVGNASLGGAARLLLSPERARADMGKLFAAVSEINLADHPRFNELFIENMSFITPCTL